MDGRARVGRPGSRHLLLAALALTTAISTPAAPQGLPCKPCGGLVTDDPHSALVALRTAPPLPREALLVIAWSVDLDGTAVAAPAADLAEAGATPWLSLVFHTAPPVLEHPDQLGRELAAAADMARQTPPGTFFQILWQPTGGAATVPDYAYLLKRAAVAVGGARPGARIASAPQPTDAQALAALYAEDVAPYLDALALTPAEPGAVAAAVARINQLDPGRDIVLDALPAPPEPRLALARAAEMAAAGAALTLFRGDGRTPALVPPLELLASEFQGDLSFDPDSGPSGAHAWSFVRGKDLGLRVIAETPADQADQLTLSFPDPQLTHPQRVRFNDRRAIPLAGVRRRPDAIEVQVADPGPVAVLRLERPSVAELSGVEGVAEKVTVAGAREMPVAEILRRLQTFEDAQNRRVEHWSAINTTQLRFALGVGTQTFEATLQGPFFFERGGDIDWAWQSFYVNGVKWKWKKIPEIPLIQPEKAAALPLEIHFSKEYVYRLRGTETVDGRSAWAIDFEPADPKAPGKLYKGTVWVDRQIYARLRTRAVQLGLEGEVISNEETLDYTPVDAHGRPAPWSADSYILPLKRKAEQLLSIVNATTLVERETDFTDVEINGSDFAERRKEVAASDVTMVRDTDKGLRYLVKEEGSQGRVVKEGYDKDKLFLAGGVFYDDALDYPLPLAGVNYFSFDFKGTGAQVNTFFAGALLTGNIAQPRLFGSRVDAGADVFAIAIPFSDTLFRDNREVPAEEVKERPASLAFKLGRPLGSFVKLRSEFRFGYSHYSRTKNTDDRFVLPRDTLSQAVTLGGRFTRGGYQLDLEGSYHRRSNWDFWGLPGNAEFDPSQRDYYLWSGSLAKNWFLPYFQKVGLEVDYVGGSDLDRFSKYQFGFFGDTRVHGYQSNRVRATEAWLAHATYGFELGQYLRLDGVVDAALATDPTAGLDRDLLSGVGISGTFLGPWKTIVNLDVGTPVAGPDSGFVAFVAFLKLFK